MADDATAKAALDPVEHADEAEKDAVETQREPFSTTVDVGLNPSGPTTAVVLEVVDDNGGGNNLSARDGAGGGGGTGSLTLGTVLAMVVLLLLNGSD